MPVARGEQPEAVFAAATTGDQASAPGLLRAEGVSACLRGGMPHLASLGPAPVGAPSLGLFALVRPHLAARRCLHPFGQRAGVASSDKRSLAAHGDPHAFQGIEQNTPPREPGPELARLVSCLGIVFWHGTSPLLRASPSSQHTDTKNERPGNLETQQARLTAASDLAATRGNWGVGRGSTPTCPERQRSCSATVMVLLTACDSESAVCGREK